MTYTRIEMIELARRWMIDNYRGENDEIQCQRLGLLIDFIADHFPK
jgi:hypothetical protein